LITKAFRKSSGDCSYILIYRFPPFISALEVCTKAWYAVQPNIFLNKRLKLLLMSVAMVPEYQMPGGVGPDVLEDVTIRNGGGHDGHGETGEYAVRRGRKSTFG
jgi:hypothetical protein